MEHVLLKMNAVTALVLQLAAVPQGNHFLYTFENNIGQKESS